MWLSVYTLQGHCRNVHGILNAFMEFTSFFFLNRDWSVFKMYDTMYILVATDNLQ